MGATSTSAWKRTILTTLWITLLAIFIGLRFDASTKNYFMADDQVVVWLVDDAVNNGNWQPDWYRAAKNSNRANYFEEEIAKNDVLHEHHYNFSAHILLSAAIIKPLRSIGITTPTITLMHHIALFWDMVSVFCLIAAARKLGGLQLALCSAIIYTIFPLSVQGSHYARPDALLTAMGSILLWLAIGKTSWRHWQWLLLNALALGIAVGGKASQLMLGIFPALACSAILLDKTLRSKKLLADTVISGLILLLLTAAVLQLIFFFGDISAKDFWLSVQSIQLYYQHPSPPDTLEHYSVGAQLLNTLHYFYASLGWPLLLAMLAGVVALARIPQKLPLLLLVVPLLLFIVYFASVPAFFDRSFCGLAAAMALLAAVGVTAVVNNIATLPAKPYLAVLLAALVCWKPAIIQYHLQSSHLRNLNNSKKITFQQQLRQSWSRMAGVDFWLKNIDRVDMFSQKLPEKPPSNPRIYVAEDLNDWNSRDYLQKLSDNGFVPIAEFRGDFADMPTNSLITVHEAARFVYFVRADELPPPMPATAIPHD